MNANANINASENANATTTAAPGTNASTSSPAAPGKPSQKFQIINLTLLSYFLRKHRVLIIVMALCAAAYSVMIVALWPMVLDDSFKEMMETLAASLPGLDAESFMMSLGQYLETQWLGVYWLPLAGAVLIVLAGKAIAGSINDGSMETVFANPLRRGVYLNTVVLAILLISLILGIATIAPLAALGPLFDARLEPGTVAILLAAACLILFVFGLMVLAVSAWTRGVVLAASFAVAFILVMIVLYVATPFVGFLENLNPVNLLHWWGSATIIDTGEAEPGLWIWLAVVGVVSLLASYAGFLRRDIT